MAGFIKVDVDKLPTQSLNTQINKEIFYNLKCGVCGNKRYLIIQNSSYEMVSTFMGLLVIFLPSFGFNMIFVPIYLIIYMSFTYAYIIPYMRKYSKEDIIPPPLW